MKCYLNKRLNHVKCKEINTIVTGLSYARRAIDDELAPKQLLNLAMDSSDLYSNYLIAKKALELNGKIKNAIIGLSYFSFEYDLEKIEVNSKYDCEIIYRDLVNDSRKIPKNILIDFEGLKSDNYWDGNIGHLKDASVGNLTLLRYEIKERKNICKDEAIRDSNKNYPVTVEKNIKRIKKYMDMLKLIDVEQ